MIWSSGQKVTRRTPRPRLAGGGIAVRGRMAMCSTAAACGLAALTAVASPHADAAIRAGPRAYVAVSTHTPSGPALRIESATAFSTFNPFLAYFDGDTDVLGSIYPTLTTVDEQGRPAPYLATKWIISPDKLTWTFTIRPGLKWSDAIPITADDAAWTFNLIMKNPVAATANGSLVSNFASVTAPNPATLVIRTKKPQADLLYVGIPIVPEHVWAKEVSGLADFRNVNFPVVGYGPWILAGYVPNQYVTLKANRSFFMGAPKYGTLIDEYYSDSDAAVAALRSGQLDEIDALTATQYEALRGNKQHVGLCLSAPNGWTAIEINPGARTRSGKPIGNGNPILHDPRVREAIALAINRNVLTSRVLDGLGLPGAAYLPPAFPLWSWTPPADDSFSYDPARANRILDAAGYRMGPAGIRVDPATGEQLSFRLGIHSDEITDSQMAPYLVEWMQAIGIKLTVQAMSFTQLNTDLPKGDWDILSDAWATGTDPAYLLSIQTCATLPLSNGTAGNTDAFFCDPAYDQLFNQQNAQFGQAQRARTVRAMQQILYNANVDIILYYSDGLSAVRTSDTSDFFYGKPNAQGFYPLQDDFISWRTATPVAGDTSPASGGLYAIAGLMVLAAALGTGVVIRRRATAGERE